MFITLYTYSVCSSVIMCEFHIEPENWKRFQICLGTKLKICLSLGINKNIQAGIQGVRWPKKNN